MPSCKIPARKEPWVVVEKCDACDRYVDDLTAASSLFQVAGWFTCNNGAQHALAAIVAQRTQPTHWMSGHSTDDARDHPMGY